MVASEATPYAKTGGLADVIGSLPPALRARGEDVAVVLPLYPSAQRLVTSAEWVYNRMPVWLTPANHYEVNIRRLVDRGTFVYFVDCPELFQRDGIYGENGRDYPDNHIRFAVFCRAALGVVRFLFRPDIVHCHDWQAGLVGAMMRHQFAADPTFTGIRTLMTIHNLGYQGHFPRQALAEVGLPADLYRPDLLEFWGGVNYLKAGIVFADAISTVSPSYAREIQTPEHGFGMDGLLRARSADLAGIVNGVDYSEWSPENDSHIAAHFSASDLAGKRACKADLLRSFGLPYTDLERPLVGMVSRFVHQKGFDLIEGMADAMMAEGVLFVAIGTGEPHFEWVMRSLAERYPGRAAVSVGYDNAVAHKIEAGSDIFLMPSRYEPCGLNQIYSLRYGTVPVVRATGGLDDTVDDSTGFKFSEYSSDALLARLRDALEAYGDRKKWHDMMREGMRRDYSWDSSAGAYSELYGRIASR